MKIQSGRINLCKIWLFGLKQFFNVLAFDRFWFFSLLSTLLMLVLPTSLVIKSAFSKNVFMGKVASGIVFNIEISGAAILLKLLMKQQ